ncbi:MAG: O-antigen ligase family protein [Cryomorphaceae bacterium]|nr:O-antigen ligase family protein [Cryomorphaceae bacterium]
MRFAAVILQFGLIWFAFGLPFQPKWLPTSLGMMLAGVGWLVLLFRLKPHFRLKPLLLLPLLLFLLNVVGAYYSTDVSRASKIISLSIPLAAFPLLFQTKVAQQLAPQLLRFFLASSVFAAVVTLGYLLWTVVISPQPGITYRQFSPFTHIPSHYLAMYFSFAGGAWWLMSAREKSPWFHFIPGLILLLTSLLMNARIQFLVVLIVMIWTMVFAFKHYELTLKRKLLVLLGCVLLLGSVFTLPENQRRIKETRDEWRNMAKVDESKQKNHRVYLWSYGLGVIQDAPLWGHGTGDANQQLQDAYQSSDAQFWDGEGLYYMRDVGYNYHNQYLQSWAANGILAFLILLAILFVLIKSPHPASKMLAVVLFFSMVTESILERQAGVFFMGFLFVVVASLRPADDV